MLQPFELDAINKVEDEYKCKESEGCIVGFWPSSDIKAIIPLADGTVSIKFKRKGTYGGKYYSRQMVKLEFE